MYQSCAKVLKFLILIEIYNNNSVSIAIISVSLSLSFRTIEENHWNYLYVGDQCTIYIKEKVIFCGWLRIGVCVRLCESKMVSTLA